MSSRPARRARRASWGATVAVLGLLAAGCQSSVMPDDADVPPGTTDAVGDPSAPGDPSTSARPVTLAFAGDVHFEGSLAGAPSDPGSTLGPMSKVLGEADLAMVNLESALTPGGAPASKEREDPVERYWFRSPPAALDLLDRSGVDVVSVANNHGADYGVAGLRDTLRIAERSPVAVVGAGATLLEAYEPHRVSIRGTDVAVLAADASPLESDDPIWSVRPGSGPGLATARAADVGPIVSAVRAADRKADLVVVYLHWGEEGQACPTGSQQRLAQTLTDAGADVVVGTHAHVQLGAGMLGSTYVSYGLGNFFWYHGIQSETGVLRLSVADGEVVGEDWLPARIPQAGGAPLPLVGTDRPRATADRDRLRGCTNLAPAPSDPSAPSAPGAPAADALPAYASTVDRIGSVVRRRMSSSHDPARCPVPLRDLRHLTLSYVGFDGRPHRGEMVVNADVAGDVVGLFKTLYRARFPIQRMRLVDDYGGDDNRSMAANNTSGYNCRTVAGQSTFSDHAFGRAIDINPVQNPYVTGGRVLPPAGRGFVSVDRSAGATAGPGVIREGDVVTGAFARLGWTWGGEFSEPDYQHFSKG